MAVVGSILILKFVDVVIGLRVSESEETAGLDAATQHGETAYVFEGDLIHLSGVSAFSEKARSAEVIPTNFALETK